MNLLTYPSYLNEQLFLVDYPDDFQDEASFESFVEQASAQLKEKFQFQNGCYYDTNLFDSSDIDRVYGYLLSFKLVANKCVLLCSLKNVLMRSNFTDTELKANTIKCDVYKDSVFSEQIGKFLQKVQSIDLNLQINPAHLEKPVTILKLHLRLPLRMKPQTINWAIFGVDQYVDEDELQKFSSILTNVATQNGITLEDPKAVVITTETVEENRLSNLVNNIKQRLFDTKAIDIVFFAGKTMNSLYEHVKEMTEASEINFPNQFLNMEHFNEQLFPFKYCENILRKAFFKSGGSFEKKLSYHGMNGILLIGVVKSKNDPDLVGVCSMFGEHLENIYSTCFFSDFEEHIANYSSIKKRLPRHILLYYQDDTGTLQSLIHQTIQALKIPATTIHIHRSFNARIAPSCRNFESYFAEAPFGISSVFLLLSSRNLLTFFNVTQNDGDCFKELETLGELTFIQLAYSFKNIFGLNIPAVVVYANSIIDRHILYRKINPDSAGAIQEARSRPYWL